MSMSLLLAALALAPEAADRSKPPYVPYWMEFGPKGEPKALRSLARFADCVVKHPSPELAAYLKLPIPSDQSSEKGQLVANKSASACFSKVLKLDPPYLRGALIEAAYKQRVTGPTFELGDIAPDSENAPSARLASCVAERSSQDSRAVLFTEPGSRAQSEAMAKLVPVMRSCASSATASGVEPQLFRFQLAEALYRTRTTAEGMRP